MKKFVFFLAVCLVFTAIVIAEEGVIIDFNELVDDYQGEHQATLVDFSDIAGTRYTEEEKAAMSTSLYLPNWNVKLSSSSRSVLNDSLSYVRSVTVNDTSTHFEGQQILGVRLHFPEGLFNSYAWVLPPFEIPAFGTSSVIEDAPKGEQFNNFGVLKNMGVLKSIKVNVYGLNFPLGLNIVLRDENEQTQQIPMGYMDFDGWRELVWENPNYIGEVRDRELKKFPLYPRSAPSITLDSIQFYRDAMFEGGDTVAYVKDIRATYDLALVQDIDSDLSHEEIWGILSEREEVRRVFELDRLGDLQVLRYLEEQKMHVESEEETP